MQNTVLIAVADGIEEIEAVTLIDILRRANVDVTVASIYTERKKVCGAHRIELVADCLIDDCKNQSFDMVIVPGGLPGAENLANSTDLVEILKNQVDQGKFYGAICASPALVLEKHGLLKGRQATCYPAFLEQLGSKAAHPSLRVVIDGNCLTSQGPGTAMEYGLAIVSTLCDKTKAQTLKEQLLAA